MTARAVRPWTSPHKPALILWDIDHTLVDIGEVSREIHARAFEAVAGQPLQATLTVADNCQQHYAQAPPNIRRQLNQGFFTKLFIDQNGSVERAELTEPFATLLAAEAGSVRDVLHPAGR